MDEELLLMDQQRQWFLKMESTSEDAAEIVVIMAEDLGLLGLLSWLSI